MVEDDKSLARKSSNRGQKVVQKLIKMNEETQSLEKRLRQVTEETPNAASLVSSASQCTPKGVPNKQRSYMVPDSPELLKEKCGLLKPLENSPG